MNTPTSIAYTHTFNDKGEITGRQVSAFYFLPKGCASYADVPIGTRFQVAYVGSWDLVELEVIWHQVDKVDAEPCRCYCQKDRWALTADEIELLTGGAK